MKESELSVAVKPRKPKSREVRSRYMSPSSSPSHSIDIGNPSPVQTLSPVRRKPDSRKNLPVQLDESSASLRGLWPSSTATPSSSLSSSATAKFNTLADHLGNERLNDLLERKNSVFLDRQRSTRFENDKDITTSSKENHRPIIGGSMRYTGNPRLQGKSKVVNSSEMATGRYSVDENALFQKPSSRRMSDVFFTGNMDSKPEFSDSGSRARKSGIEVSSRYMNDIGATTTRQQDRRGTSDSNLSLDNSPRLGKSTVQKDIKRANSLTGFGSSKSRWALSPGRSDLLPLSVENKGKPMSFSSLKPPNSPSRTRGVEKLINLGFDFFRTRKSSSNSSSASSPSSSCSSLPGGYGGAAESGQQLWNLHNRLMLWRFANAKANYANVNLANHVESKFICCWDGLTKLRHSVAQKKLQLGKEKLEMKLNLILQSQLKLLEAWGDMERQHSAAVSMTKESLHSVICKLPLTEGAKIDAQSVSTTFGHALDLAPSIISMLTTFSPPVEENVSLISELAEVVAQEKLFLEECSELFRTISNLEIEERSLRCSIMQWSHWKNRSTRVYKKDKKNQFL